MFCAHIYIYMIRRSLHICKKKKKKKSLRKQAYSNTLKILPPKPENFQIVFIFLLKTLIVGTR